MRSKQRQADGEGRWLQSLRCGGDITSLFPGSPAGLNQSNPRSESCGRGERSGEAGLGKGRGNPKAQREEMKLSSLWPQAALVAITTVGAVTAAAKTLFSVLPTLGPDMTIVEVSGVWPDRKREAQGTRKWWEELEKAIPSLVLAWNWSKQHTQTQRTEPTNSAQIPARPLEDTQERSEQHCKCFEPDLTLNLQFQAAAST